MLRDALQHRRAVAEVQRLKELPQDAATRERIREGELELLCWDWEHEGKAAKVVATPPPLPRRDPRAIRCADWYERNAPMWDPPMHWADAFEAWIHPQTMSAREALDLYEDFSDEMHDREFAREIGESA